MNELALAKAFLYVDDPYGDGIRLAHVREPSAARVAATNIVYYGQSSFDAVPLMLRERGDAIFKALSTKAGREDAIRNGDLTRGEIEDLRKPV